MPLPEGWEVVWSGRDPLLPDRPEHWDRRIEMCETLDDEEETAKPKRRYVRSGKHRGKFTQAAKRARLNARESGR